MDESTTHDVCTVCGDQYPLLPESARGLCLACALERIEQRRKMTTLDLLRAARLSGVDVVAIDRLLELGYPLDRAQRACKPYERSVSSIPPDTGLVDRWVDGLRETVRLQTELRMALRHQQWARDRLMQIVGKMRDASNVEAFDRITSEHSMPEALGIMFREMRARAIEIQVSCEVYLASPTGAPSVACGMPCPGLTCTCVLDSGHTGRHLGHRDGDAVEWDS